MIHPKAPYWAVGFPSACLVLLGTDFAFASGTMFSVGVERAERCGRAIPGDDADRVRDRPQLVHDRLQWGSQGAVEQLWRLRGPGSDETATTRHRQLS